MTKPSSPTPARVRTRFAPSPTGFIHLGNIRSALYPWAFARAKGGDFVLRIEDTDLERSTQAAVDVILESMDWLGMKPDEGPYYQMQRMDRYKEVLARLQAAGHVYPCYMSKQELDALRASQEAAREKPRYDGTPTYNFCVVVDDMDMGITHVIRGDDHVNNTPRQINIFRALGHEPPVYAHLPTVLNEQGEKMSKRNGAKAVTQYRDEGYLADAMINYLARLGWSHGDDEIFSREQFLAWFDLDHLGKSAAQFDEAKLRWVNAQHIKAMPDAELAPLVAGQLQKRGIAQTDERLPAICALFKDRCETTVALAGWARAYYADVQPPQQELDQFVTDAIRPAIASLHDRLKAVSEWNAAAISAAVKQTLAEHGLKMPQLAMPVRVLVMGTHQTPSLDAVLALHHQQKVLDCLRKA